MGVTNVGDVVIFVWPWAADMQWMWQDWRMFSSIGTICIVFWTSSARIAITMEVNLVRSSTRREAPKGVQWADSVQLQCLGSVMMFQLRTYTPPAAAAMAEHRAMCVGATISSSYFCLIWGCSELHCSLRLFLSTLPFFPLSFQGDGSATWSAGHLAYSCFLPSLSFLGIIPK